ncbi:MAG: hypothetical protein Unbinned1524contig1000_63 [Prokaryotic dsDNA virus sp.]|nr:MAG: hypothetical protein Unbinned1524contig1000_63 [Prokaryotic dsDNA virus sp.]|tara:strand:- start:876 stop:1199 length:324 start_codon:yes stop_codon:yes gene_type:complete
MALKQKYIEEVKNNECKFDEWFIDELMEHPYEVGINVMMQLEKNLNNLHSRKVWSQQIAGVVKQKHPFFFEIEYIKEGKHHPILFIDINEIDCDTYLDYINQNKSLK